MASSNDIAAAREALEAAHHNLAVAIAVRLDTGGTWADAWNDYIADEIPTDRDCVANSRSALHRRMAPWVESVRDVYKGRHVVTAQRALAEMCERHLT